MLSTLTLVAPAAWASGLINDDWSGVDDWEHAAALAWLEREGLDYPVDCSDSFFSWRHDAWEFSPYGGGCAEYTFYVND